MSMLGLSVGTTGRASISCDSKKRVRMSFEFEPTTSLRTSAPICLAIHPASTLPKLPVGTLNEAGLPSWAMAVK